MSLELATKGNYKVAREDNLWFSDEYTLKGVVASNSSFVNSTQTGAFVGAQGTKITINVPGEWISLKDSYLEFQITASAGSTAGIVGSFVPDIRSIFSRMTVQCSGQTILDVQNFNILQNIFNTTLDPQWANSTGSVLVASDSSQANRQAYFLLPNKTYACRMAFTEGIENLFSKCMLPIGKVGSEFQIWLFLENPQNVISTNISPTGTLPSYQVNNVQFHYRSIVPSEELNMYYNEKIQNNNFISFSYRAYDSQIDTTSIQSGINSATKYLSFKYSSILGLILAFQPSTLAGTWTSDAKMNTFSNPALSNLQLKIGSVFYPLDSASVDSDILGRYILMFGLEPDQPYAGAINWGTTSFVPTCPLAKYPSKVRSDDRYTVPGIDSSISTQMVLNLNFAAPTSQAYTLYIYCVYNTTITFNKNGSLSLFN